MNSEYRIAKTRIACWCLLMVAASLMAAQPPSASALAKPEPRLQWWQDARFGMFIHWGPISLKGTEIGWSRGAQVPNAEYDQLYRAFHPTNFNADAWARTAKEAGMKYLVLTTRHHDGFSLWNTKQSEYSIMRTPFGRDAVKELAQACRRQGIKFCTYYSLCDWWHPDYPLGSPGGRTAKPNPNMDRYVDYMKKQLAELITSYGPLGIVWFDGEWEKPWTMERGQDLYRYLRAMQPSLIINNRVSKGRAGLDGVSPKDAFAGDYDTPEQTIGKYQADRPWETCMTICEQWAWKPDDRMKPLAQCLQTLVRCAGGDGNLLFNVGPMPDGRIEPRQVERLQEMGAWLRKNGESVYGTRGGPFLPTSDMAATRKGKTIFLHVFRWEDLGPMQLPPLPCKVKSARLLGHGLVEYQQDATGLTVQVPLIFRDPVDTVIKLTLDRPAAEIPPVKPISLNLCEGKQATASNVYRQTEAYGADKAMDGNQDTRWATDEGTKQAWLEVDLGAPATFDRVAIDEAYAGRVKRFELQCPQEGAWNTIFSGTTIGARYQHAFPPVTAQKVRLTILESSDGPTIKEFQLFPAKKR
jgi:alpha-L-fucosidase